MNVVGANANGTALQSPAMKLQPGKHMLVVGGPDAAGKTVTDIVPAAGDESKVATNQVPATKVKKIQVKGTVLLIKKHFLDLTNHLTGAADDVSDLLGKGISFQLVSATAGDPNKLGRGKVGKEAFLEQWETSQPPLPTTNEVKYNVTFEWERDSGIPGAVIVKNYHQFEFYLTTIILKNFPRKGRLVFICNSWIYPVDKYRYDRIFFTNETFLPSNTPAALQAYRKEELYNLKSDHINRQLEEYDRAYGYDYYNDLGEPEQGPDKARPVLGGSKDLPYPRRCRTNRPPNDADPSAESRVDKNLFFNNVYVPRDERFGHLKSSDFLAYKLKAAMQILPAFLGSLHPGGKEFTKFQDILDLYEGGIKLPEIPELEKLKEQIPLPLIKELFRSDGEEFLKFPVPQIIQDNKSAWSSDQEFAREMLAGCNPNVISRLREFPPTSGLDPKKYGNQISTITAAQIEKNMDGFTVEKALNDNRLFILNHHDSLMPYLNRINSGTNNKVYASRTVLFLQDDDTLKPLAIELSLPHPGGEERGAASKVFTPAKNGVEGSIWQLAKAYVGVNDSGIHQLVSHWLNTHAAMEPFIIATNRQLSVMHPIFKLLSPHYRDTMDINSQARQSLISAGGVIESTFFPGKYSMELSSVVYRNWKFTEQALPADLLKRGMAVEDANSPHGLRLLITDYPYAVDGLEIWSAIETWVRDFCSIYYPNDDAIKSDEELQAWWKEVREVGHGDLKDEPWWPAMDSLSSLVLTCSTIIWIGSALHAAVNFGQYAYAGYVPNRPTNSRVLMPEVGTPEYQELERDYEGYFLKTITDKTDTLQEVSLIQILSRHASDEVYLGGRDTAEWAAEQAAVNAFTKFGDKLMEIEDGIEERNKDKELKNRNGPAKVPYTLLYPNTGDYASATGLSGKGVPNSISI